VVLYRHVIVGLLLVAYLGYSSLLLLFCLG